MTREVDYAVSGAAKIVDCDFLTRIVPPSLAKVRFNQVSESAIVEIRRDPTY